MKLDIQDKFLQRDGRVFLTGMEAIVRLVREKQERDQASGHVNQTYFTGYEGSPLGGLDLKIVAQLEMLNEPVMVEQNRRRDRVAGQRPLAAALVLCCHRSRPRTMRALRVLNPNAEVMNDPRR